MKTAHLADQLTRAFEGGAWHGPAVFELLQGVAAARANRRLAGVHTIRELVLHVAAWLEVARRRALGEAVELSDSENFPADADGSEDAWAAAQRRLREAFVALRGALVSMGDDSLARPAASQEYSVHFLLDGAIQHSLYHAGQIALLLKSQDATPRDDGGRALLRHTLATLAYRAEKPLRAPPPRFAEHRIGPESRTPLEIVGHLGDLLEWAESMTRGPPDWKAASSGTWDADVARFFAALARLDQQLASAAPLANPAAKIFQGPIADALTHVGQLTLLRGHFGAPVRPESYARAEIAPGRVGADQSANRTEFDGDASARAKA